MNEIGWIKMPCGSKLLSSSNAWAYYVTSDTCYTTKGCVGGNQTNHSCADFKPEI